MARCLLGPDGATLMHSPSAARRRLRALAMATPPSPSLSWIDRCVPLARALARHASEVDRTTLPTAAQTRVAHSARELAAAIERVGLVWRVRSGDPETDMDPLAQGLSRVATEMDLAGAQRAALPEDPGAPVAPPAPEAPAGYLEPTPGLEPLHPGSPERFFVGAPLPVLEEVVREGERWRVTMLTNERAFAWTASGHAIVRVDAPTLRAADGLSELRVFVPGVARAAHARVTAVNDPLEGIHVVMDAVESGDALWLAQWTPWGGTVLARFAGDDAAAVVLQPAEPGAGARATDPATGATIARDEHVAIAPMGTGVVVAFTRATAPGRALLTLASSLASHDQAPVDRIAERSLAGQHPGVGFCARGSDLLLVAAAAREWLVLRVDPEGADEVLRVPASSSAGFDERVVVRCAADALVAYGSVHPRGSPLVVCRAAPHASAACEALWMPSAPMLATMPLYTTRTPSGRALLHGEWPFEVVSAGEVLLAARAAGPIVALARRPARMRSWSTERVVFDAAARTHGALVEGLGLYAEGARVTLAISAPDGLHIFTSDDAGESWH